jgi:hypothetical protein
MNAETRIRNLVKRTLADNHNVDGVEFVDQLLLVAAEVGEIKCTIADEGGLRFQTPDQVAWTVTVDRARSKLRMVCARLAALCLEGGTRDVSIYGGEGLITKHAPQDGVAAPARKSDGARELSAPARPVAVLDEWTARFKNTASEQEFTIALLERKS